MSKLHALAAAALFASGSVTPKVDNYRAATGLAIQEKHIFRIDRRIADKPRETKAHMKLRKSRSVKRKQQRKSRKRNRT